MKFQAKWNITQMEYYSTWNVTKRNDTQHGMSLKLECHSNWKVTIIEKPLNFESPSYCNVTLF